MFQYIFNDTNLDINRNTIDKLKDNLYYDETLDTLLLSDSGLYKIINDKK